jgi:hypothetical protein
MLSARLALSAKGSRACSVKDGLYGITLLTIGTSRLLSKTCSGRAVERGNRGESNLLPRQESAVIV